VQEEEAALMNRKVLFALVLAGVGVMASVTSAAAATNLGAAFPPTDLCAANTTYIQVASPGTPYAVPSDGVITGWTFDGGSVVPPTVKLKVGRALPGTNLGMDANLGIVGESAPEVPRASSVNTYATRVPVKSGDFLGIYLGPPNATVPCVRLVPGFADLYKNGDVPSPSTAPFTYEDGAQFDLAAVLEPDADHDGYGDETQDQCPANGTTQGPCPSKCKHRKKKHRSAETAKKKKKCKRRKK
jgi:hypothetical protein